MTKKNYLGSYPRVFLQILNKKKNKQKLGNTKEKKIRTA